jgi:hypothetical protein
MLSFKMDRINIHCVYFPPSLATDLMLSPLHFLLLHSDTIIYADFNAWLDDFVDDNSPLQGVQLLKLGSKNVASK